MKFSPSGALLRLRLPLILATNLLMTCAGFWLALALRFDFDWERTFQPNLVSALAILLLTRTATYIYWDLNRGYWRYSSTRDLLDIVKAHAVSSACFTAAVFFFRITEFPRSVILIELVFSIFMSGGVRFAVRLACESFLAPSLSRSSHDSKDVVVLGAGDSGHLLVKTLVSHKRMRYRPVTVLDDSPRVQGLSVYGVRVAGRIEDLPRVLDRHPSVVGVVLAIPSYSPERFADLSELCRRRGLSVKRLQSFEDIACFDSGLLPSEASIESLLDRTVKVEHEDEIRNAIQGKRVLVTGGGGSIGSELVRQVIDFNPASLVVLDHSEYNLFRAEREFSKLRPEVEKHFELASVCDERRLDGVFERHGPQLVYHAAAYKHVPLLETNCYEAVRTNVFGTRNVIAAAIRAGAKRFVLISSDKAVEPCSVMGASKRVAEALVQNAVSGATSGFGAEVPDSFTACAVRFGNVINSAGSVIPLFREQILGGGPVTVTHPKMERFFMSIREAVRLVLSAGTLGERGAVYLLDMGKPIRILELAHRMLELYGRQDIPIVFTGVRPGERLKESLTNSHETRTRTRLSKVNHVDCGAPVGYELFDWLGDFDARLGSMEMASIGEELMTFVMRMQERALVARAAADR